MTLMEKEKAWIRRNVWLSLEGLSQGWELFGRPGSPERVLSTIRHGYDPIRYVCLPLDEERVAKRWGLL